jgi:hypothetical protein
MKHCRRRIAEARWPILQNFKNKHFSFYTFISLKGLSTTRPRPHFGDLVFGLVDPSPSKKTSGEGGGASPGMIYKLIFNEFGK